MLHDKKRKYVAIITKQRADVLKSRKTKIFWIPLRYYQLFLSLHIPSGLKDICKMCNSSLVITARHHPNIFFKMSKRQIFYKSKQYLIKSLFTHLENTSQRHLRRVVKTTKTTCKDAFKISKRQLFCKSNQLLSKPSFRQVISTSATCLELISVSIAFSQ